MMRKHEGEQVMLQCYKRLQGAVTSGWCNLSRCELKLQRRNYNRGGGLLLQSSEGVALVPDDKVPKEHADLVYEVVLMMPLVGLSRRRISIRVWMMEMLCALDGLE
ncbi:hypothetical protein AVEN_226784-1 [Araneus ventricosus]|uniref:Uncharacterized protein n=1 Tax=Araneus ventricosus TaxID=182803 RepID=A0A4Y2QCF4_ARAVE|nr:hypothetical protein AVEN_226784-1 [Araneus ventricosus]